MRMNMTTCLAMVGLAVAMMSGRANAQAMPSHTIDWYTNHPKALVNGMAMCNTQNGLIGTQNCRNVIVAAHIVSQRPGGIEAAVAASKPK